MNKKTEIDQTLLAMIYFCMNHASMFYSITTYHDLIAKQANHKKKGFTLIDKHINKQFSLSLLVET